MRDDISHELTWRDWALAAVLGAIIAILSGCDAPKKPCCPGSCEPVVQVAWFSAEWCEPCKRQAPEAKEILRGVTWRKIDIDREPKLADNNKVTVVPTYVVFVDGRERGRASSARDLRKILGR